MSKSINFSKVEPLESIKGEDQDETRELKGLAERARKYLEAFSWCEGIKKGYFGIGVDGIVAVFLFNIIPNAEGVDDWVWVIVGDLPPAYISVDDSPNPAAALDSYIGAMQQWVEAAKTGRSVDELIPVNVPPTKDNALQLESRLGFIDREILVDYAEDLKE